MSVDLRAADGWVSAREDEAESDAGRASREDGCVFMEEGSPGILLTSWAAWDSMAPSQGGVYWLVFAVRGAVRQAIPTQRARQIRAIANVQTTLGATSLESS